MKRLVLGLALIWRAAAVDAADSATIDVVSASGEILRYSVADLERLGASEIRAVDPHSAKSQRYRGVALSVLLSKAGVPSGKALRGTALATAIEVEAADGYRVAFSVGELDPGIGNTAALVAFKLDGMPLDEHIGPFRVVVPGDKRAARWVRQVVKIGVHELRP
ncbi:MAG TPA: molybdopterin-dependent oxidoreductase [Candidatus Binatia bacterium]|nr:molybdopterin-dependent oxidoreductase [Candidatus Binatia bacterium]